MEEIEEGYYCGCCGTELEEGKEDNLWCNRCEKHVSHENIPFSERTYQAQNSEPCPYQVY